MDIKAENTRRIRELEAEFSDEKMAELFRADDAKEIYARKRVGLTEKIWIRFILGIAVPVCCVIVLLQFFSPRIVFETSMKNTLNPRDCVVLARYAFGSSEDVKFGDIIIHSSNIAGVGIVERDLIKRVIGLPGDRIEIGDGSVFRNGEKIYEPYTYGSLTVGSLSPVTVPEDCFFVLGDNRQNDTDSLYAGAGFVKMEQVVGQVVFRIFPVSRAGGIA